MNSPFIFTGFSDEIDADIRVQFAHLNEIGIRYFEPRNISGTNISDLTVPEAEALKALMDEKGIRVSSIGSPIGKIGIEEDFPGHLDKLRHTMEIARILGTRCIRIFSFYIPEGQHSLWRDEVLRRTKAMASLAAEADILLLHENEKGIYGDTAARCREILDEVHSGHLRAVFDPANFIQCGEVTWPDAYRLLRPYISYMHIKDALLDGTVVPAGYGEGHVGEILSDLKATGYRGFLSLEPHLGTFEGLSSLSREDGRRLSSEKSSADKFDLAFTALKALLEKDGETA